MSDPNVGHVQALINASQAKYDEAKTRELHRLIGLYGMEIEGTEARVTSEIEAVRLLNDSLQMTAHYLYQYGSDRDNRHLDDHEDYTNAASDTLVWILGRLHEELDEAVLVATVNRVLNAHMDEFDEDEEFFTFADHDTPLFSLMHLARNENCSRCLYGSGLDEQNDSVRDN